MNSNVRHSIGPSKQVRLTHNRLRYRCWHGKMTIPWPLAGTNMSLRPCITMSAIFRDQVCEKVKLDLLPTYHVPLALNELLPKLQVL